MSDQQPMSKWHQKSNSYEPANKPKDTSQVTVEAQLYDQDKKPMEINIFFDLVYAIEAKFKRHY